MNLLSFNPLKGGFIFFYSFLILSTEVAYGGSRIFFHLGRAVQKDKASHWGDQAKREDIGRLTAGLTYKTPFTDRLIDVNLRAELTSYDLGEDKRHVKFSLLPLIILPSVDSFFPLYVGIGGGFGTFLKQVYDESYFTLDYQFLVGLRLIRILGQIGAFVEVSQKNYVFFSGPARYSGWGLSLGAFVNF